MVLCRTRQAFIFKNHYSTLLLNHTASNQVYNCLKHMDTHLTQKNNCRFFILPHDEVYLFSIHSTFEQVTVSTIYYNDSNTFI